MATINFFTYVRLGIELVKCRIELKKKKIQVNIDSKYRLDWLDAKRLKHYLGTYNIRLPSVEIVDKLVNYSKNSM